MEENLAVFIAGQEGKFGGAKLYTDGDRLQAVAVAGFGMEETEIFKK